jgi:hypothetical protein
LAYPSPNPHDDDPLLQLRATWMLGGITALLALFFVYTVAEAWAEDDLQRLAMPGPWWLGGAGALLATLTLYCRYGRRTVRQVYLADAVGLLATGVLIAKTSSYFPVGYRPEFTTLIALTLTFVGRSAIVPSTARRTAVLCALASLPLGLLTWQTYADYVPPAAGWPSMSSSGVTLFIMIWWLNQRA